MAVPPIVIKAIATAATDKRTWEFIAMLIAAVFLPVILCVMSVAILVTGAAPHAGRSGGGSGVRLSQGAG